MVNDVTVCPSGHEATLMQDRYVGDVGDFGKYGLLGSLFRCVVRTSTVRRSASACSGTGSMGRTLQTTGEGGGGTLSISFALRVQSCASVSVTETYMRRCGGS